MSDKIQHLLNNQLKDWDTARNNYEALNGIKTKALRVNNCEFNVQFNPARIVSSGAKVDAKSIQERKCFLCADNRPKEQTGLDFGENYTILVNPFPIFPKHFTIPENSHVPQTIISRFDDMFDLAEFMSDYVIFYNGPKCGASAPDHAHFQAGNKGFLPLEKNWEKHIAKKLSEKLSVINYVFSAFLIETDNKAEAVSLFDKIYHSLTINEGEIEPMMNILAWRNNKKWVAVIIPRAKHRPDCYFAEGEENMLISPASVDLGGVFITPIEKDFEKINEKNIEAILQEVCFDKNNFQKIIEEFLSK